jgi:prevent-host-death family protein
MNVTATEAKNRLGQVLEQAQSKPVFIEKAGRPHSVVISSKRYAELLAVEAGLTLAERKRRFNERYKDWIAEQNERFEKRGLWNDEFRSW